MTCDLHYELDWDLLLEAKLECSELESATDPCFATYACLCDNGYFRVTQNMPEPPETYLGSSNSSTLDLYKEFLSENDFSGEVNTNQKHKWTELRTDPDNDGLGAGEILGIFMGSVIGLILIITIVYFVILKNH